MNCEEVQALLHAYVDGEVDLVRNLQIEQHLPACDRCDQQLKGLRVLREAVARNSLYFRSPPALHARITNILHEAQPGQRPSRRRALLAAGILLLFCIAGSGLAIWFWARSPTDDRLAEAVLTSHLRSLQAAHLTDVLSSDRHTVKPWFVGKIDYSPPIVDLSAEGFVLTGGRLDYLDGRAVASLVYRRRQHVINLFVWPGAGDPQTGARSLSRHGFHLREWRMAGMNYWAISDLNDLELDQFVRLVQEHSLER
jgi:anti-sigma factor RsiW